MSKKKQKTRFEKLVTKHDFSHLTKTKTAAKIVQAEVESKEAASPLDLEIHSDLKVGLIVIGLFIIAIVALWLVVGRNGEIFKFVDNLKLF